MQIFHTAFGSLLKQRTRTSPNSFLDTLLDVLYVVAIVPGIVVVLVQFVQDQEQMEYCLHLVS
jgi:hypothetical protein